jgi:hypothetical protein
MGFKSPLSTPGKISSEYSTTREPSTPWSDILLEELRNTIQVTSPSRLLKRYKTGDVEILRRRNRLIWLAILLAIGLTYAINRLHHGNDLLILTSDKKGNYLIPDLNGLQFIDANHPYIRVSQPSHCE